MTGSGQKVAPSVHPARRRWLALKSARVAHMGNSPTQVPVQNAQLESSKDRCSPRNALTVAHRKCRRLVLRYANPAYLEGPETTVRTVQLDDTQATMPVNARTVRSAGTNPMLGCIIVCTVTGTPGQVRARLHASTAWKTTLLMIFHV